MKLLIAPVHYYISESLGSEYTRAYESLKYISQDNNISGDAIVGYSDESRMGKINIHSLYHQKPLYISSFDRFIFPFLVFIKSLALMKKNTYDCIWHIGPFAIDRTFSLLALWNRKRVRFVIGPVFTPFDLKKNRKHAKKDEKIPFWQRVDIFFYKYFSSIFKFLFLLTLRYSNKIIVIEKVGSELLKERQITNTEVIHLGIIPDKFFVKSRNKKIVFFNLLTACYLIERKRVIDLVDAVNLMVNKFNKKKFLLTIVGGGPIKKYLEKSVSSLGLNRYIKFVGQIPRTKVHNYYKKSDIFVSASTLDSMPGMYFEAMTASLPMVVSENDSSLELLEDHFGGIVVEGKNPDKFARAILKIMNNPKLYAKMSRRNCQLVKTTYNYDNAMKRIKNILSLYEK